MIRQQIIARGVRDPAVLDVLARVPRERFVPVGQQSYAYDDRALAIESGQTISQPYIVAVMTEMLEVRAGHRVLEVGTGSGYQTALLVALGAKVWTIERVADLARRAEQVLTNLKLSPEQIHIGDGSLGLPDQAPFDRILITAAAPAVPPTLIEQLVEGGLLVAPVGPTDQQVLVQVIRRGGRIVERPGLACRFVKLIGQQGWNQNGGSSAGQP